MTVLQKLSSQTDPKVCQYMKYIHIPSKYETLLVDFHVVTIALLDLPIT